MVMTMETPLKRIREELGVSRERLVRRTETVSLGTIRNGEYGRRITVGNAQQILKAVNGLLREAGRDEIELSDLGLVLY